MNIEMKKMRGRKKYSRYDLLTSEQKTLSMEIQNLFLDWFGLLFSTSRSVYPHFAIFLPQFAIFPTLLHSIRPLEKITKWYWKKIPNKSSSNYLKVLKHLLYMRKTMSNTAGKVLF